MDYNYEEEGFAINDDHVADWAIRKIKEEEDERDRLVEIATAQIEALQEEIDNLTQACKKKTAFLEGHLERYFETVPHKETKTQETYKLLSGSLVMKKPSMKISYDEDKLLEWLEEGKEEDLIKTKRSVNWAEFKKRLTLMDDLRVVDSESGEILDGICSAEPVSAVFSIKF